MSIVHARSAPRPPIANPQPDLDDQLLALVRRHLLDTTSEADMRRTAKLLSVLTQLKAWTS